MKMTLGAFGLAAVLIAVAMGQELGARQIASDNQVAAARTTEMAPWASAGQGTITAAYLVGTPVGWAGTPARSVRSFGIVPELNDGKTIHRLHVPADLPVDGLWSISVHGGQGFFTRNAFDAYSINNINATRNADRSVDIQFGGCDGTVPNCLSTPAGWNYTVRLYRPQAAILDGSWKFPEALPAG